MTQRRQQGQQPLGAQSLEDWRDLEMEWRDQWPPTIVNDGGRDILDPEADERAFMNELCETWERLYWQS